MKDAWMETVKEVGVNGLGMTAGQPAKSAEERKLVAMERAFCESFLENLKKL